MDASIVIDRVLHATCCLCMQLNLRLIVCGKGLACGAVRRTDVCVRVARARSPLSRVRAPMSSPQRFKPCLRGPCSLPVMLLNLGKVPAVLRGRGFGRLVARLSCFRAPRSLRRRCLRSARSTERENLQKQPLASTQSQLQEKVRAQGDRKLPRETVLRCAQVATLGQVRGSSRPLPRRCNGCSWACSRGRIAPCRTH